MDSSIPTASEKSLRGSGAALYCSATEPGEYVVVCPQLTRSKDTAVREAPLNRFANRRASEKLELSRLANRKLDSPTSASEKEQFISLAAAKLQPMTWAFWN